MHPLLLIHVLWYQHHMALGGVLPGWGTVDHRVHLRREHLRRSIVAWREWCVERGEERGGEGRVVKRVVCGEREREWL